MIKLGILFGGVSPEHDVSVKSAETIINAVDSKKFQVVPIFISPQGKWDIDFWELKNRVDIIFPVLHGIFGEDGTVQGMMELMDIPYVGADTKASSIGLDKALFKQVLCEKNLPVVQYNLLYKENFSKQFADTVRAVESTFGYPCFVKPANCGSSIGISMVKAEEGLKKAIDKAFRYDRKVLIEKAVVGREIELALLGNYCPEVSAPGEIIAADEFYSYEAKYFNKESVVVIPAKLPEPMVLKMQKIAKSAYSAIDCCGMARVDFFVENDTQNIYINEINTIPGFTHISMYPLLWEKSGVPLQKLISKLVGLGFMRYEEKNRLVRKDKEIVAAAK